MAGADAPGGMVEGLQKKKDSAPRTKRPLDSSQGGGYGSRPRGSTYSPAQHRSSGDERAEAHLSRLSHAWGAG